jgi:hypothetical protein
MGKYVANRMQENKWVKPLGNPKTNRREADKQVSHVRKRKSSRFLKSTHQGLWKREGEKEKWGNSVARPPAPHPQP